MDFKDIIYAALDEGFIDANIVPTEKFLIVPEYRQYCEENVCGKYGKNYSCPPVCGTPQEMKERVMKYKYGLVMQTTWPVDDPMNNDETGMLKKEHTRMTNEAIKKLKDMGIEGMAAMAGGCNLCKVCKYETGEPCPFPDLTASCVSAYCIDISRLCAEAEMEFSWTGSEVSFFSIYMFNE